MVQPRKISDFKPTLSKLALTSHYQVIFGGLSSPLRRHLDSRGVGFRFIGQTAGLLCSNAVLPGSSSATFNVDGIIPLITDTADVINITANAVDIPAVLNSQ